MSDFNLTQLKDLDYICELASTFLKEAEVDEFIAEIGIEWPKRVEMYRKLLAQRIDAWEHEG